MAFALSCWLAAACGRTVEVGIDDALSAGGAAGTSAGGSLNLAGEVADAPGGAGVETGGSGEVPCVVTPCRGKVYQCGNCIDDDQDGAADALDSACLGPCDDDEAGLGTGLSGSQSMACRRDCYFDGDAGPGNDQCTWSDACDPLSVAPDYPPSGEARCESDAQVVGGVDCEAVAAEQPTACIEACLPLVPNGCDCFGCCELPAGSGSFRSVAGRGIREEGCSLDNLTDSTRCPPCTPVPSCFNECEGCEACVGSGLPADCEPDGACPAGPACGPEDGCSSGEYCVTGCCVPAPKPT